MTKLHVGALGTLGVLTELNLRLVRRAAAQASLAAPAATVREAFDLALRAFKESLVASSILVFGGDRAGLSLPEEGAATVLLTASGHPADVREELRVLGGASEGAPAPGPCDAAGETAWSQWQRRADAAEGILIRLGVPNRCLADVLAHPALEGAGFVADAATGVVWARLAGLEPEALARLREAVRGLGGYAALLAAPRSLFLSADPHGHRPDLAPYMERLRRRWDPGDILNPGRFRFA
jgi:FAD/FMN-containing dehydrogenase